MHNKTFSSTMNEDKTKKKFVPAENQPNLVLDDEKKFLYKDLFIIRFRQEEGHDDNSARNIALTDIELYKIIKAHSRTSDDYWKTVEVIQSCIKSSYGIGEPLNVNYYSPLDEKNPKAEIDFHYDHKFASDLELIQAGKDLEYCQK